MPGNNLPTPFAFYESVSKSRLKTKSVLNLRDDASCDNSRVSIDAHLHIFVGERCVYGCRWSLNELSFFRFRGKLAAFIGSREIIRDNSVERLLVTAQIRIEPLILKQL